MEPCHCLLRNCEFHPNLATIATPKPAPSTLHPQGLTFVVSKLHPKTDAPPLARIHHRTSKAQHSNTFDLAPPRPLQTHHHFPTSKARKLPPPSSHTTHFNGGPKTMPPPCKPTQVPDCGSANQISFL